MTNEYQQIEACKNVIDWLNSRCRAFTDHTRKHDPWLVMEGAATGITEPSSDLATTE